ncbi:MAG TPA: hypothetical protein VM118_01650, partial [Acidobacteriota bacterium]|nr:hypothetical protein [Acidobacteriota bacterium]
MGTKKQLSTAFRLWMTAFGTAIVAVIAVLSFARGCGGDATQTQTADAQSNITIQMERFERFVDRTKSSIPDSLRAAQHRAGERGFGGPRPNSILTYEIR